jgi:hypothetical protein
LLRLCLGAAVTRVSRAPCATEGGPKYCNLGWNASSRSSRIPLWEAKHACNHVCGFCHRPSDGRYFRGRGNRHAGKSGPGLSDLEPQRWAAPGRLHSHPGAPKVSVLLTRHYAPSGDFVRLAYAATTSHRVTSVEPHSWQFGSEAAPVDCGDFGGTPFKRRPVFCHPILVLVEEDTARAASASVPIPDTMSTGTQARECQPRPTGGGRSCADQWPGRSRHPSEDGGPDRG